MLNMFNEFFTKNDRLYYKLVKELQSVSILLQGGASETTN